MGLFDLGPDSTSILKEAESAKWETNGIFHLRASFVCEGSSVDKSGLSKIFRENFKVFSQDDILDLSIEPIDRQKDHYLRLASQTIRILAIGY